MVIRPSTTAPIMMVFFLRNAFNCMEGIVLREYYPKLATAFVLRPCAVEVQKIRSLTQTIYCSSSAPFLRDSCRLAAHHFASHHSNECWIGSLTFGGANLMIAIEIGGCQKIVSRSFLDPELQLRWRVVVERVIRPVICCFARGDQGLSDPRKTPLVLFVLDG